MLAPLGVGSSAARVRRGSPGLVCVGLMACLLVGPIGTARGQSIAPGDTLMDDRTEAAAAQPETDREDALDALHPAFLPGAPVPGEGTLRYHLAVGSGPSPGIRGMFASGPVRSTIRVDSHNRVGGLSWSRGGRRVVVGRLRIRFGNALLVGRDGYNTVAPAVPRSGTAWSIRPSRGIRGHRDGVAIAMQSGRIWGAATRWTGVDSGALASLAALRTHGTIALAGGWLRDVRAPSAAPYALAYASVGRGHSRASWELARMGRATLASGAFRFGARPAIHAVIEKTREATTDGVVRMDVPRRLQRAFLHISTRAGNTRVRLAVAHVVTPSRPMPSVLRRITLGFARRADVAGVEGDVRWTRRRRDKKAQPVAAGAFARPDDALRFRVRIESTRRAQVWQRIDVRYFTRVGVRGGGVSLWWRSGWNGRFARVDVLAGRYDLEAGEVDYAGGPSVVGVAGVIP